MLLIFWGRILLFSYDWPGLTLYLRLASTLQWSSCFCLLSAEFIGMSWLNFLLWLSFKLVLWSYYLCQKVRAELTGDWKRLLTVTLHTVFVCLCIYHCVRLEVQAKPLHWCHCLPGPPMWDFPVRAGTLVDQSSQASLLTATELCNSTFYCQAFVIVW